MNDAGGSGLSHYDDEGRPRQVDVGDKPKTARVAEAAGRLRLSQAARKAITDGAIKKGDPLQVARIAGIQGAKRTAELIPLCHQVPLSHVEVDARLDGDGIEVVATVRATWETGVEMEAMVAVTVALLTAYDMLKAVDKGLVLETVRLVRKSGGRSGDFVAP